MPPTPAEPDAETVSFLDVIAKGNPEATELLKAGWRFCHAVDDVIDEAQWNADAILNTSALGIAFYSHPFYRRNIAALRMPVLIATSWYEDSVNWEKAPELWKRRWADVLRHAWNGVIMAVAYLVGGYEHMQAVSRPLLASCYVYHADRYGVPQ